MNRPDLAPFWRCLARAPARLLMLDYDGTLAPLTPDRAAARAAPGVVPALVRARATGTRLALVSGRPAAQVAALLAVEPAPEIWGCHGWERRWPGGAEHRWPLPPGADRALAAARAAAAAAGAGAGLEVKAAAVAVHWRGLPAASARRLAAAVVAAWRPLGRADSPLALRRFDGGCELLARGRDKGDVVRELLAEAGPGTVAAYVGDDATDEDAFLALRGRGLALLVASRPRPTAAGARLRGTGEVLGFLDRWCRTEAAGRRGER